METMSKFLDADHMWNKFQTWFDNNPIMRWLVIICIAVYALLYLVLTK